MQTKWFRPVQTSTLNVAGDSGATASTPKRSDTITQGEHALMAEALLRATVGLLDRVDPTAVVEQFCRHMVEASPHIPLVWAWFGDPHALTLKPQVVVGPARAVAGELVVARDFLTQNAEAPRFAYDEPTRSFEISPLSMHGPWRRAAMQYGARSVLVVPIAAAGDQRGLLTLYSSRSKYFEAMGTGLFEALGPIFHAVLIRAQARRDDSADDAALDRLTGLPSRSHAQRMIDDLWRRESVSDNRGVLLIANIDEFQRINAACGRRVGDIALRHVSQLFEQTLRRSDLLTRWRNDEFLAWLPALPGTVAFATAEQLRLRVAESSLDALDGLDLPLHISIGATPVPANNSFATALERADRALTRAKQNGRNCVVVARPDA